MIINMREIFCILIFLSCFSQGAFGAANDKQSIVDAQRRIQNLAKAIENWEVGSIEIVWINPLHVFNSLVTPVTLDKAYGRKLVIRYFHGMKIQKDIFSALRATAISSFDHPQSGEVRLGVKFFSAGDGHLISSLYFSSDGTIGYVDQTPVSFKKSPFFNWLNLNVSKFFLQLDGE